MGGTHGHGAVVVEADEPVFHEPWEGRVYGLMRGMRAAGLFNLDQFRHARERQSPIDYLGSTYYQSWLSALELIARETGAIVPDETLAEQRPEPAFKAGDAVMTRNINPQGHTRLPRYARAPPRDRGLGPRAVQAARHERPPSRPRLGARLHGPFRCTGAVGRRS